MLKTALAGALALAVMGSSWVQAETPGSRPSADATAQSGFVLTSGQIVRIKSTLKLTPAQERHWAPVEAVMRDILQREQRAVLDSASVRRILVAAAPLIDSLNDDQKRQALVLAQTMGLSTAAMF